VAVALEQPEAQAAKHEFLEGWRDCDEDKCVEGVRKRAIGIEGRAVALGLSLLQEREDREQGHHADDDQHTDERDARKRP